MLWPPGNLCYARVGKRQGAASLNNNSANGRIRLLVMCGTLGVGGAQVQVAHLIPKLNREIFDVQVGYYNAKPDFPKYT
jgi:hypothetical protein